LERLREALLFLSPASRERVPPLPKRRERGHLYEVTLFPSPDEEREDPAEGRLERLREALSPLNYSIKKSLDSIIQAQPSINSNFFLFYSP
jgi:hypothetical protein